MKNKKILILSIIVNVVFLLIICILISGDRNIIKGKQLVKEMTQSENETNLNAQITQLNKSHTDYANSIEESKKKIASAITEKGVDTSSDVTLDIMAENIKSISSNSAPEITIGSWSGQNNLGNIRFTVPKGYTKVMPLANSGTTTLTRNGSITNMSSLVVYDVQEGDIIHTYAASSSTGAGLKLY